MSLQKLIANYTEFNLWANQRIHEMLIKLDESILYTQTPSSFNSIDYTLQHMLRTQRYWNLFITGASTEGFNWAVREGEVQLIMAELIDISATMVKNFRAFSEKDLQEILNLDTPWAKNQLPRYEYIFHVINHSTFHRGQIITMLRSLGITDGILNTDYNIFNTLK